eukprot:420569_1
MAFHFNVSSDASHDVNIILFKLVVLRYLTKYSSGESFAVTPNHAFFVELPSKLSSLTATTIQDVMKHFYFVTKSDGIIQIEVQDSLQPSSKYLWSDKQCITNELEITDKEMFVYKYLDALDQGLLKNVAPDWDRNITEPDWDYKTHKNIDEKRMIELIDLYCKPGRTSLVFLKSFLQYMYQQLLLLYTSRYAQNTQSQMYRYGKKEQTGQFHRLIAKSLTKSAEQIACHMYQI